MPDIMRVREPATNRGDTVSLSAESFNRS